MMKLILTYYPNESRKIAAKLYREIRAARRNNPRLRKRMQFTHIAGDMSNAAFARGIDSRLAGKTDEAFIYMYIAYEAQWSAKFAA